MITVQAEQGKIEEQSTFRMLLNHLCISSLEELNLILFQPTKNAEYYKLISQYIKKNSTEALSPLLHHNNYKEICEYYGSKEELVPEVKTLILHKYQQLDIIRAHQQRKEMWLILSKAKFRIKEEPNYYELLKKIDYPEYYTKVIDADVRRTAPESTEEGLLKLRNILGCLTRRNPYVGYCQGMNFVVNFLIMMQFEEQECFWIAVQLFEQILPKNYYTNMQGIAIDLKLIDAFLQIQRPKIHQLLTSLSIMVGVPLHYYTAVQCSPDYKQVLMPLWDLLLAEGTSALLKAVIVIIDQLATVIFSCHDFSKFYLYADDFLLALQPFKKSITFEESSFLTKLQAVFIDKTLINYARRIYGCLLQGEHKDSKKKAQVTCDLKWPICHQRLQKNKIDQVDPQPWVLKEEGPPRMIENYLDLKTKRQKVSRQDTREQKKKLVIGRMPHTCQPQLYDKLRGDIELNEYDSQTNSYIPAGSNLDESVLNFLKSASVIDATFIFNAPHE